MNASRLQRRALWAFVTVMLLLFGTADLLFFLQQRNQLLDEARRYTSHELELVGELAREAVVKGDYVTAEGFIQHWAERRSDVIAVRVTAPNGFEISSYRRGDDAQGPAFEHTVEFNGKPLLILHLVRDFTPLEGELLRFLARLLGTTLLFAVVLGALLWRTLRTTAIRPLEREVRERKQAEQSLREGEEHLRAIIDNVADGIVTIDESGIIESANPATFDIFGYEPGEIIGKNADLLISESQRSTDGCYLTDHLRKGVKRFHDGAPREVIGVRKDARPFSLELTLSEMHFGGRRHFIGILRDIGARKQVEQALRRARDEAVETAQLKSSFLANMSHEIRTPMNGVLGMLELLRDTTLNPEQQRLVQTAYGSGEILLALINDILDLSKLDAGKLELEQIPFDLHKAAETVVGILAPRAYKKGLQMRLMFGKGVPTHVVGDPVRLKQVLTNLLGNAVKFTEEGEVCMRISLAEPPAKDGKLPMRFEVTDTGIGISPEAQAHIFDTFTQADGSTTRRFGGTGLGLAISTQLVEVMGGGIAVQSRPGLGSSFSFTVALQSAETPESAAVGASPPPPDTATQEPQAGNRLRLLVVEDNEVNQMVAVGMLNKLGYPAEVAANGREAVEAVGRQAYDLVLMDVQMPVLDGYEATRQIRSMENGSHTLIVAMTANAMEGDRERCLEAGMDDYLAKPLQLGDLAAVTRRWLRQGATAANLQPPE